MDDCAGDMGEIEGGMTQPEAIDTAPPEIVEGKATGPRTTGKREDSIGLLQLLVVQEVQEVTMGEIHFKSLILGTELCAK
eukprot:1281760-Amphidinium_carterae.1